MQATPTTDPSKNSSNTDTPPEGLDVEAQPVPLTSREKKLVKNLAGLYTTVGAVIASVRLLPGQIIIGGAPDRAEEVVKWARHHPEWMARLEKVVEGNDGINMAIGHIAMLFAILVSVDRIPVGPRSGALLNAIGYGELVKLKVQQGGAPDGSEAVAA